jgi:hypothetical protein
MFSRIRAPASEFPSPSAAVCWPVWRSDGRELFYVNPFSGQDGVSMMAVPVTTTDGRFSAGTPQRLFTGQFGMLQPVSNYDVTPDGQRFLMDQRIERPPEPPNELVLVQHWFEELKRRVPTK